LLSFIGWSPYFASRDGKGGLGRVSSLCIGGIQAWNNEVVRRFEA